MIAILEGMRFHKHISFVGRSFSYHSLALHTGLGGKHLIIDVV